MGSGIDGIASIYTGLVVHKRARPKRHELRYRVFSLLVDLDRVDELPRRLRLFGLNRVNLVSLWFKDFGPHDGSNPATFIRLKARDAGIMGDIARVRMLAYPRVFGYAFNPLTVYFLENAAGEAIGLVHEVHNTFGQYHFYVAPVTPGAELRHEADKAFYVSPFNTLEGRYRFSIRPPGAAVFLGIVLGTREGGLLSAWFDGRRQRLNDGLLAKLLLAYPLMTVKVFAGIHFEALRLWLKGVPLTLRLRRQFRQAE